MIGGILGCSNHALAEIVILSNISLTEGRVRTMNFMSAYFMLFKGLLKKVPWETVPRDIGMEQTRQLFKVPCNPMEFFNSMMILYYYLE